MYNGYGSQNEFVERVTRVFILHMRSLGQNHPLSTERCICGTVKSLIIFGHPILKSWLKPWVVSSLAWVGHFFFVLKTGQHQKDWCDKIIRLWNLWFAEFPHFSSLLHAYEKWQTEKLTNHQYSCLFLFFWHTFINRQYFKLAGTHHRMGCRLGMWHIHISVCSVKFLEAVIYEEHISHFIAHR